MRISDQSSPRAPTMAQPSRQEESTLVTHDEFVDRMRRAAARNPKPMNLVRGRELTNEEMFKMENGFPFIWVDPKPEGTATPPARLPPDSPSGPTRPGVVAIEKAAAPASSTSALPKRRPRRLSQAQREANLQLSAVDALTGQNLYAMPSEPATRKRRRSQAGDAAGEGGGPP